MLHKQHLISCWNQSALPVYLEFMDTVGRERNLTSTVFINMRMNKMMKIQRHRFRLSRLTTVMLPLLLIAPLLPACYTKFPLEPHHPIQPKHCFPHRRLLAYCWWRPAEHQFSTGWMADWFKQHHTTANAMEPVHTGRTPCILNHRQSFPIRIKLQRYIKQDRYPDRQPPLVDSTLQLHRKPSFTLT